MKKLSAIVLTMILLAATVLPVSRAGRADSQNLLTPTPRPANALPESENLQQLQDIMLNTENCQLPCFWGFHPGETSLEAIRSAIGATGEVIYDVYYLEYFYFEELVDVVPTPTNDGNYWVPPPPIASIYFGITNRQFTHMEADLSELETGWLPPDTVELSHVLAETDSIPDVYLFVKVTTGIFSITVVYNDLGIAIRYRYDFRAGQVFPNSDEPIQICPRVEQLTNVEMWLQSPDNETLIEDRINPAAPSGFMRDSRYNKTLEFATDMTPEAFVEQLVADPESCIATRPFNELLRNGMELY